MSEFSPPCATEGSNMYSICQLGQGFVSVQFGALVHAAEHARLTNASENLSIACVL